MSWKAIIILLLLLLLVVIICIYFANTVNYWVLSFKY